MLPAARSVGRLGKGGSAAAWTGEKRRKTTHPPPVGTSDDDADAMMMDAVQLQDPPEEDGSRVFSAQDVITYEELLPYLRQKTIPATHLSYHLLPQEKCVEMYERFYQLRIQDYLSHKVCELDGDTSIAPTDPKMLRVHFYDWNDDPKLDCTFDWTIAHQYFYLAELTDYQRIIPTRSVYEDYLDWEGYYSTLSIYETDEDYVKYIDELSKKVKWIGEHMYLDKDDREFSKLNGRAYNQAMKIAAGLSHLPVHLAIRGYTEYIWHLRHYSTFLKDMDRFFFEIWKRVTKQEMGFKQALEEINAANMFPSQRCQVDFEMDGGDLQWQFNSCIRHLPENAEDDAVLEHITHTVDNEIRVKTYVDYARKKLEIGRRLHFVHTVSSDP